MVSKLIIVPTIILNQLIQILLILSLIYLETIPRLTISAIFILEIRLILRHLSPAIIAI